MKKSTANLISGALLSAGGAVLAMAACSKLRKDQYETLEDTDMRNSKKSTGWKASMPEKIRMKKG